MVGPQTAATAYAVVLLSGTSHALRAEKALRRADIGCKLIPVPRHLSSDCGVCLRIAPGDVEAARAALAEACVALEAICLL